MANSTSPLTVAWIAYWLPIFQLLILQCTNPCREVRNAALNSLQRTLLSPDLVCSDHREWTAIFSDVLFPLIHNLLKPEVFQSDRDGMSETRVEVASLLCKVFLQYLVLLSAWDGMLDLWLKIVDIMDRFMNSGQGDSLVSSLSPSDIDLHPNHRFCRRRRCVKTSRMWSCSCQATITWSPRPLTLKRRNYGRKPGSGLIGFCLTSRLIWHWM
jgi:hypothetical protein